MPNPVVDMTTVEQRINYFHLLDAVIAHQVRGDVVELGCFTGQCALLFQRVVQLYQADKTLHLFDSFETQFTLKGSVEEELKRNFKEEGLPLPVLHKGYFQDTLPTQLPGQIAFVHIDCGFGGDAQQHKSVVQYCLEEVYPKMSVGAVCVLMDYHDRTAPGTGYDANPGVKMACDEFLATKPEQMVSLYGNHYSHGFFRKAGAPG
ncbi:TylF/MycF/NovP-related O-methyltransferase [Hymenobacter nivis]|uniref:TylF/MycF/NovP-related O-methyltransferase n=1 Tax=Hymenobacter nivis TaxID=1850093 RepID=UPI001375E635|nr:TylF/MycF/NovP-related O-methyltransferase [Hymenobacter nivis]